MLLFLINNKPLTDVPLEGNSRRVDIFINEINHYRCYITNKAKNMSSNKPEIKLYQQTVLVRVKH